MATSPLALSTVAYASTSTARHHVVHPSHERRVAEHHVVRHHVVAHRTAERHVATHRAEHRVAERHVVVHHRLAERHVVVHRRLAERHVVAHHRVERRVARAETKAYIRHASYKHLLSKSGKAHYARASYRGISCVPFARVASGIELKGNAANWWDAAAGIYQRGNRPEPGAVLNFRAIGRMRLGHVAVVTAVLGDREIEIEHANWAGPGARKGGISRGIRVEDVSAHNDWTAVRVALGHSDTFGSVYPTYGFIYDRPDNGRMVANVERGPGTPTDRVLMNEVAEAPLPARMTTSTLPLDAPDHSLR